MKKSPPPGKRRRAQVVYDHHAGGIRASGTVTMPDGSRRRIQAQGQTEEAARERWEQRRAAIAEEIKYGERKKAGKVSLAEGIEELLQGYTVAPRDGARGEKLLRDSTVERMRCAYRRLIKPEPIGSFLIKDVTPADVARWKADVSTRASPYTGRPLSASSRQRALQLIDDIMQQYRPEDNPVRVAGKWHQKPAKKQAQAVLTPPEIAELLKYCWRTREAATDGLGPVYAGITIIMIYCYPRPGEVYALQARDWHVDSGRLDIHRTGTHSDGRLKTANSFREIYPPGPAAALLNEAASKKKPGERLFPAGRGKIIDPRNYSRWLANALKDCGIDRPGFSPHKLRGTGISYAISLGVPPEIVQANAGHASISTTLGWYTKIYDDSRKAAASLYGKEDNGDLD